LQERLVVAPYDETQGADLDLNFLRGQFTYQSVKPEDGGGEAIKDITAAQAAAQIKAIQNRTRGIELTKQAIAEEARLARVAAEKLPPNKKSVELARIAQKEANQLNELQQKELRTANNVAKAKLELNELLTKAKGEQGLLNDEQLQQELNQIRVNELMLKYNILIKEGVISAEELKKKLEEAVGALSNEDSESGKFKGFVEGLKEIIKEATNLNDVLGQYAVDAVDNFANTFADFVATGKANFRDFANSILKDLARIFARAAFYQALGAVFSALRITGSADGNVIAKNKIVPYAMGGIVNKPTLFPMANGAGLMGEAGPEAIMPLRRGANGKLGVEASGSGIGNITVNVDASGSSVEGDASEAAQLGRMLGAAVQAELVKQKRPGGLLAS